MREELLRRIKPVTPVQVSSFEMGATLTDLAEILYAHPGLGEALRESAENALGRAVHMLVKE